MKTTVKRLPVLTGAILAFGLAGSAIAGGDSLGLKVPAHAKVQRLYKVTVHGHAATNERLYLFIDVFKCAKNPHAERVAHSAPGYFWYVKGSFSKTTKWRWNSPNPVTDHACAYLQDPSQPLNAAGGVVAHAFKHYRIAK
jgi:hypothetical protein